MDPQEIRALGSRITALMKAKDWDAAEDALAEFCEAQPQSHRAWCFRARVQSKLGNKRTALRYVQKALEIVPDFKEALELQRKLETGDEDSGKTPTGGGIEQDTPNFCDLEAIAQSRMQSLISGVGSAAGAAFLLTKCQ